MSSVVHRLHERLHAFRQRDARNAPRLRHDDFERDARISAGSPIFVNEHWHTHRLPAPGLTLDASHAVRVHVLQDAVLVLVDGERVAFHGWEARVLIRRPAGRPLEDVHLADLAPYARKLAVVAHDFAILLDHASNLVGPGDHERVEDVRREPALGLDDVLAVEEARQLADVADVLHG